MQSPREAQKTAVVVAINVFVALLHFVTGSNYSGPFPAFVNGYLLNILVPFGFYFLLCLTELSLLKSWIVKSILVFGAASFVEVAQFFGVPLFGRTYDPVDIAMSALGVMLAAILDTTVFPHFFASWTPPARLSN